MCTISVCNVHKIHKIGTSRRYSRFGSTLIPRRVGGMRAGKVTREVRSPRVWPTLVCSTGGLRLFSGAFALTEKNPKLPLLLATTRAQCQCSECYSHVYHFFVCVSIIKLHKKNHVCQLASRVPNEICHQVL